MGSRLIQLPLMATMLVPMTTSAPSWGASGHRIVAEVGSRHLSAASVGAVERILGPGQLALARSATWPDEIRSDGRWNDVQPWHFLTVEDGAHYRDHIRRAATIDSVRNVAEAIWFFSELLEGDADKRTQFETFMNDRGVEPYRGSTEAAALSLLVHFVGDVHQPLHVGRGADLGGNTIDVNWFEAPTNLHSVWDEHLIEKQELSFTELSLIIDVATDEQVAEWQRASLGTWIQESIDLRGQVYEIGSSDVPGDVPNPRRLPLRFQNPFPYLGYHYAFLNTETVNRRLVKGGVRLAALLNRVLD